EGVYRPAAFVLEPDYLLDVTSVADCFQKSGTLPEKHLLRKFLPVPSSPALMLGNVANYFLDELIQRPDITFQEVFRGVFGLRPLAFCLFDDNQVREVYQKAKGHFLTIKTILSRDFAEQGIEREQVELEPTFLSEYYGLQGRLDVLYRGGKQTKIVELKSGSVYQPNRYMISEPHFMQVLLYDLLIRSTYGHRENIVSYILYSKEQDSPLRPATRVTDKQYEALQLRNQLLATERQMAALQGPDLLQLGQQFFGRLHPKHFPDKLGFTGKDLAEVTLALHKLDPVGKLYFYAFTGFIAREHQLAKVGQHGFQHRNGQASLWLDSFSQKNDEYNLLAPLELVDNKAGEDEPLLSFARTSTSEQLTNFRVGDIAVLYPACQDRFEILRHQLFKCTIIELTKDRVVVRLRARQLRPDVFSQERQWHIEHDLLDSSFNTMYRSLFAFTRFQESARALWLGQLAPRFEPDKEVHPPLSLTQEQQRIFTKIIAAKDYFLLWGPPGTGKTSMMLRYLVEYLLDRTDEQLLLLAYTNRAVDEMCHAIESIGDQIKDDYLRIGSRYSTDARYRSQLLREKMTGLNRREDILQLISRHRIVVGTVASVSGRRELFRLKKFDRIIVDEASQILEPLLMGMLPLAKRAVLIGDHRQLPAVVAQSVKDSEVSVSELRDLGLDNLRVSLFERLYHRCRAEGWEWAYGQLSNQGRMHKQVMRFPAHHFYADRLHILPEGIPVRMRQEAPLLFGDGPFAEALDQLLSEERVVFLPTPVDESSSTQKTNRYEAARVAEVLESYLRLTAASQQTLSMGVITPYRAQIAQLRQEVLGRGLALPPELLTIDTVERYQGGARDIIIISLCTNAVQQLASLVSPDREGFDRKLNVALTRARECVVVIGNPEILAENATYAAFMNDYRVG
ncbi:MAG: AAA domain-containing protein, partial [Bacteroidota bacterium]